MKLLLFSALMSAFILETLFNIRVGALAGLTLTNVTVVAVGFVLVLSEVPRGRISGKNLTGVRFAIIISVAVILSLIYAKYNGVYGGTFLDNFRKAKAFVFMPALLYGLPFLLIDTREQGERYLLFLVLVFGALNLASIVGAHFGIEINRVVDAYVREDESRKRLTGITGNPNKTAYLTCVLIAFQYYFFKFHKARFVRYLTAILMVGGLIVVLLSGSRGGLLVLIIVILGLAYKLRDMKVVYGAVLVIPILVGVLLSSESTLLDNAFVRMEALTSDDASEVTSGRNMIWSALLSDYTDSPIGMLFGNGFGSSLFMGLRAEPHNLYLMVLTEFGVVGLGFFIYFIFAMFRYVVRVRLDGDGALRASVLASGYVVVFAWIFTTLVGALDLVWFAIGVSMATLLSDSSIETPQKQKRVPGALIGKKRSKNML